MKTKKVKCRDVCCTSQSTDYTFLYDVYKVDLMYLIHYTFICRANPTYETYSFYTVVLPAITA